MLFINNITYWILLSFGVHVGHSLINSFVYSAWLIFVYNLKIAYINLYKSVLLTRIGFLALSAACMNYGPIWFINLDPVNRHYSKNSADLCGEYSWIGKWVHGALSNYETVSPLILKLLRTSRQWHDSRQEWHQGGANYWMTSRHSYPRAVFTPSVYASYSPVCEAFFLNIPCFGVTDTNAYTNTISIAFPGNDDSLNCLAFYNELVINYVLNKKLKIVLYWFIFIRGFKTKINKTVENIKSLDIINNNDLNSIIIEKDNIRLWQHCFNYWIKVQKFDYKIESFGGTSLYTKNSLDAGLFPKANKVSPNSIIFFKQDKNLFKEVFIDELSIMKTFFFDNLEFYKKILHFSMDYWANSIEANNIYYRLKTFRKSIFFMRNYWSKCFVGGKAKRGKMRGGLKARSPYKSNYAWIDRDIANDLMINFNSTFIAYRMILEYSYNKNLSLFSLANIGYQGYGFNVFKYLGLTKYKEIKEKNITPYIPNLSVNIFARIKLSCIRVIYKSKSIFEKFTTYNITLSSKKNYSNYSYICIMGSGTLYFIQKRFLKYINRKTKRAKNILNQKEKIFLYNNSELCEFKDYITLYNYNFVLLTIKGRKGKYINNLYRKVKNYKMNNMLFVKRILLNALGTVRLFENIYAIHCAKKFIKTFSISNIANRSFNKFFNHRFIKWSIKRKGKKYLYDNFIRLIKPSLSIFLKGRLGGLTYSRKRKYWLPTLSKNGLKYFLKYHFFFNQWGQQNNGYMLKKQWGVSNKKIKNIFNFSNNSSSKRIVIGKRNIRFYVTNLFDVSNAISKWRRIDRRTQKYFSNLSLINYVNKKFYKLSYRSRIKKWRFRRINSLEYTRNKYHKTLFAKNFSETLIKKTIFHLLRRRKKKHLSLIKFYEKEKNKKQINKIYNYWIRIRKHINRRHDIRSQHYILLDKAAKLYKDECYKKNKIEWWNIENMRKWRLRRLRREAYNKPLIINQRPYNKPFGWKDPREPKEPLIINQRPYNKPFGWKDPREPKEPLIINQRPYNKPFGWKDPREPKEPLIINQRPYNKPFGWKDPREPKEPLIINQRPYNKPFGWKDPREPKEPLIINQRPYNKYREPEKNKDDNK